MTGAQLRYCAKAGIAAGLGYLLTQGNLNQYAIYSAFTAALVVGTSVGEDLATSANRVKGTVAGIAAAMLATALFGPNPLTVGIAVSVTAVIALAGGWGIQVARVGVTVCIITLVAHDSNPVRYDVLRAANTLIGVLVGLAVSFVVWPVRSTDLLKRATRDVLDTCGRLLGAIEKGEPELRPLQGKLHDGLAAVIKAWRDLNRERRVLRTASVDEGQVTSMLRVGLDVLSCALDQPRPDVLRDLRERVDHVASTAAK